MRGRFGELWKPTFSSEAIPKSKKSHTRVKVTRFHPLGKSKYQGLIYLYGAIVHLCTKHKASRMAQSITPHHLVPLSNMNSTPFSGTATPVNHSIHPMPFPPYTVPAPNDAYTPVESLEIVSRMGVKKANMPLHKTFLSAISAGAIIAFACATFITTNTAPWYQDNAPGLVRTISALVFPYGLVIVHMTGSDLCTGSFMYTTVAAIHGRISVVKTFRHWFVTFWGNLVGSLFVCCVIIGCKSSLF